MEKNKPIQLEESRRRALLVVSVWLAMLFLLISVGRLFVWVQTQEPSHLVSFFVVLALVGVILFIRRRASLDDFSSSRKWFLSLMLFFPPSFVSLILLVSGQQSILARRIAPLGLFVMFVIHCVLSVLLETPKIARRWGWLAVFLLSVWNVVYFGFLAGDFYAPVVALFMSVLQPAFLLSLVHLLHYATEILHVSIMEGEVARKELIRTNDELNKARIEALRASNAKSSFLTNMSHELRTPLNAIIGYSEILEEDLSEYPSEYSTEEQTMDVVRIQKAGRHLLELISDILELSKIESDVLQFEPKELSIRLFLEELSNFVHPLVLENQNSFEWKLTSAVERVSFDPLRVKQCLLNVIGNAAKFTQNGSIFLDVCIDQEGETIVFQVGDNGVGMSEGELEYIYESFWQVDTTSTREFGGMGLGLSITKRLWNLMEGELEVSSELGRGSVFRFTLPLRLSLEE